MHTPMQYPAMPCVTSYMHVTCMCSTCTCMSWYHVCPPTCTCGALIRIPGDHTHLPWPSLVKTGPKVRASLSFLTTIKRGH